MLNFLGLVFSVIAAVTGTVILWWEWRSRPRFQWRLESTVEPHPKVDAKGTQTFGGPFDQAKDSFTNYLQVFQDGTAVAQDATLRARGVAVTSEDEDAKPSQYEPLVPGEDPLRLKVTVKKEGDAFLDVTWIQLRPVRRSGHSWNLRTHEMYEWHWHWWTLWLRKRPEDRLPHPVRTKGCWRLIRENPLHDIPANYQPHPPIHSRLISTGRRWLTPRQRSVSAERAAAEQFNAPASSAESDK